MRGRMGGMTECPTRSRRQLLWARSGAVLLLLLAWALMGSGGVYLRIDKTFAYLLGAMAIACALLALWILWHFRRRPPSWVVEAKLKGK
jgi:hypothetical protein